MFTGECEPGMNGKKGRPEQGMQSGTRQGQPKEASFGFQTLCRIGQ